MEKLIFPGHLTFYVNERISKRTDIPFIRKGAHMQLIAGLLLGWITAGIFFIVRKGVADSEREEKALRLQWAASEKRQVDLAKTFTREEAAGGPEALELDRAIALYGWHKTWRQGEFIEQVMARATKMNGVIMTTDADDQKRRRRLAMEDNGD